MSLSCIRCHRRLLDPVSQEFRAGKVCREKLGIGPSRGRVTKRPQAARPAKLVTPKRKPAHDQLPLPFPGEA